MCPSCHRWSTPWIGRQSVAGVAQKYRQPFTVTFMSMTNLDLPIYLSFLWTVEDGVPGENPRKHAENTDFTRAASSSD